LYYVSDVVLPIFDARLLRMSDCQNQGISVGGKSPPLLIFSEGWNRQVHCCQVENSKSEI